MEELLILGETEFQILAAAMGLTRIYGIRPKSEPDEAAVMYTIHEMAGKGILVQEGGGFRLREPYRTAVLSMKEAGWILAVTGKDREMSDACFYLGDRLVSLEESLQDESAIKIGVHEREELFPQLSDRGFLPKPFLDPDIAGLQERETAFWDEENVYARYLLLAAGGERQEAVRDFSLIREAGGYRVAERTGDLREYWEYEAQAFYEMLISCMG
ncbi:MAG: hypothetical protein HDR26_03240 [Lachnospiraceae bacterium]|nr:hypothetical protein [Lachnospiraceae bacterium]